MMSHVLEELDTPDNLRKLNEDDLPEVANAVRTTLIQSVSQTGGHLGSGLGVVELTVALHYVFDTPRDSIVWDVSHQAYPHKILTGRRHRMDSIRQGGGLSGFTKRAESVHDIFGAGHSSTSISAGLGIAVARKMQQDDGRVVAVIGDGSMSAGLAWEGLNNAGMLDTHLTVVLNDNQMSISPSTGALSSYLATLSEDQDPEAGTAEVTASGQLFEAMGFQYVGPIDGHDLSSLLPVLRKARDRSDGRPHLIHVLTRKGKGYAPAEASSDCGHGVGAFDTRTGQPHASKKGPATYSEVFGDTLTKAADKDPKIVAITAAMMSGTGLTAFQRAHPERTFDVGIAEQHAVTFAAGLATQGMRPFAAIYSTFLQRAYDQVVHDVAVQNLPVRFALDRAGYVGADGETHCGAFDITYLCCLPNFVVMAAADERELARMVMTAAEHDEGPIAFRYPRGRGLGLTIPENLEPLKMGRGRVVRGNLEQEADVAILSFGSRLPDGLLAADEIASQGRTVTVADARFAKPLDTELLGALARNHRVLITVEEGAVGGFSTQVLQHLVTCDLMHQVRVRTVCMPDRFVAHNTQQAQRAEAGLDAAAIVAAARDAFG